MLDLVGDFEARGLVHQVSSEALRGRLLAGPVTGYVGFDPTGASLHVGSLLPVLALVRLQRAGHRPIALVGGGTGLIGDPSGKQSERAMLSREALEANLQGLRAQLGRFLDFSGAHAAVLEDNAAWLSELGLLAFLRDVGKHFSVNAMIARDSVKNRLEGREQGISFTEFSYMLLQAYDFVALSRRHGCELQLGGSDQWGNIVSGVELLRRLDGNDAYGLTWPLVTKGDGTKFGKSEQGNVWLDPRLTSPFAFYQFWVNTPDADVGRFLRQCTFLPVEDVEHTLEAHAREPALREAQRTLASEVTRLVHGPEHLASAERTTRALFHGGDLRSLSEGELAQGLQDAPEHPLPRSALGTPEASLVAVLVASGLYDSRGRARAEVAQGAVSINNEKSKDIQRLLAVTDLLPGGLVVLRKGRKEHRVLRVR
jgi:tyrosyl-tRNA synthetase